MLTNFEKVVEFHECFELKIAKKFKTEIFDDKKLLKLRTDLIKEEFDELKKAIKDKDSVEVVDALGDLLYVIYGAGVSFGFDLDKAFDLIHTSNLSKLCKTEKEAKQTVEWYVKNKLYDSPTYKLSKNKKYFIVYNKNSGKILKSINYNPVDLKKLCK